MTEHNWPDDHPVGDEHDGAQPHHDPAAGGDPHEPWTAHPWSDQHWPDQHWSDQQQPADHDWSAEQADAPQVGDGHAGLSWHDEQHHGETTADTPDGGTHAAAGHGMTHVGADPDALDHAPGVDVFPPPVDVGELPEPVDGFPWIDAAALGNTPMAADPSAQPDTAGADSADLAAYAGQDPPGDGWQHLAASDDPATAALARFWHPTA